MKSVEDLNPNPKNPRKISDAKLSQLKKSMQEFGDLSGIVFNRRSGHLIGGHQRSKNLPESSEVVLTDKYKTPTLSGTVAEGYIEMDGERFRYREVDWDESREKAANIAANNGAGDWDTAQLTEWLKELENDNFDLDLTIFDDGELKSFGIEASTVSEATGVDEDEIPEQAPARTKPGYIYELGLHRLMCGDSTDPAQVARLMNGEKADMVFTDPPYGISIVSSASNSGGAKAMTGSIGQDGSKRILKPRQYKKVIGDESPETAFKAVENFPECKWIIWGGNFFAHRLPQSTHWIIWNKNSIDGAGEGAFFSDAEIAWTNLSNTSVVTYRHGWSGLFRNGPRNEELTKRVHPNQKPVGLFSEILSDYTETENIILDPFLGSGSTLIACEKTNRKCYGMEIDPHYCDVIIKRWEVYTGKKAKLLNPVKVKRKPV